MTFDQKTVVIHQEGKDKNEAAEYKIDTGKKPVSFDIHPAKGKVVKGIIRFDGDTLKICFARGDGERPTEFSSPEGQRITLMELKRAK